MSQAGILDIEASNPQIPTTFDSDSGSAIPVLNVLEILGTTTVAGSNPLSTTGSGNTLTVVGQIAQAIAVADVTKIGFCNFDSSMFTVDVDGFVSLAGGGVGVDSISPNSGTDPVVATGAGLVTIIGDGSLTTVGSLNTLTAQLTGLTNHAVQIGAGTSTLTQSNVGTNGQALLASSGGDPAFATLTSTGATVLFTTGANTLNLETSAAVPTSFLSDSGSAVPAAGILTVSGGTGINTSAATSVLTINLDSPVLVANGGTGATTLTDGGIILGSGTAAVTVTAQPVSGQLLIGSTGVDPVLATLTAGTGVSIVEGAGTITINGAGGGITWNVETGTSAAMAVNNGYISNNAGTVTFTLPSTAAFGSVFKVTGLGAGGWAIAQNASQFINLGVLVTMTGVGGSLASTDNMDSVEIVCTVANTNFNVIASIGNITVV